MAALNIAGLISNLVGVILLFLYGMPFRTRKDGKTAKTFVLPTADDTVRVERRYTWLGWLGLISIVLGTLLQVCASLI